MNASDFSIMLYDLYQMDADFPTAYFRTKKDIQRTSYEQWALDELKIFVADHLEPNKDFDTCIFIDVIGKFVKKMSDYEYHYNQKNKFLFLVAKETALDVLDVLYAMV